MDQYVIKGNKKLRLGYTTGSCAAAAAKASALMLLTGKAVSEVTINLPQSNLPQGGVLTLPISEVQMGNDQVCCAVKKDSGDDPDVTNGMLVFATVSKASHRDITLEGGTGVGRVTKPGLACKIGEAAINPVPRKMILSGVRQVCTKLCYADGLDIVISVPEGSKIASKTFNPRLGIVGGISILGTTGIVEPMSTKALVDSIYLEMRQQAALGQKNLLLCPGNYGQKFMQDSLGIATENTVKCSNYIGEALDFALELGFETLLLIGHAGKLIKLGAGIMNTHSRQADARMEILAAHLALCGASRELICKIMSSNTTEEAITVIGDQDLRLKVFASIMDKIDYYVGNRCQGKLKVGVILFSTELGILGHTRAAGELLKLHQG
jgi:cobalt-precorrin-5B (C1)-methyltransferase